MQDTATPAKKRTRNDDPAVRRAQGHLGRAIRDGRLADAAEAELDMREAIAAKRIREVVDTFPPLNDERRARLAALLRPAPTSPATQAAA